MTVSICFVLVFKMSPCSIYFRLAVWACMHSRVFVQTISHVRLRHLHSWPCLLCDGIVSGDRGLLLQQNLAAGGLGWSVAGAPSEFLVDVGAPQILTRGAAAFFTW